MRAAAALAAALLVLAGPAAADVVSKAPDGAEVVVYRDRPVRTADLANLDKDDTSGLALITETRTIDLPAGPSRVRFEGVADGIIPQSAAVEGLPAPQIERNFDYDLLSPGSLIAAMVGKPVKVVRTNPKTGKETTEIATLRSGPDGVVLETGGGVEALRCSGGPERLVFDHAPEGLADRPTLSVLTDVTRPGRYTVRVSYLTARMDWSADYIARMNSDGRTLDLSGWITLSNRTAVSFKDAPTAVVAGRLARAPVELPQIVTKDVALNCWPNETTHGGWPQPEPPPPPPQIQPRPMAMAMPAPPPPGTMEVIVTAQKRQSVQQSNLGDYKLYSLAEPTTVAARQTKQVQFLHKEAVAFETAYVHRVNIWPGYRSDPDQQQPTTITLRLQNKAVNGLGQSLPAGQVALRRSGVGRELYVGEYGVRDVPVGEPFEIETGSAAKVFTQDRVISDTLVGDKDHPREVIALEVVAFNRKTDPAAVEIRHAGGFLQGFKVDVENAPHTTKGGDPVWRLAVPAGGERTLTYSVSFDR
jgi:hypothetical protein